MRIRIVKDLLGFFFYCLDFRSPSPEVFSFFFDDHLIVQLVTVSFCCQAFHGKLRRTYSSDPNLLVHAAYAGARTYPGFRILPPRKASKALLILYDFEGQRMDQLAAVAQHTLTLIGFFFFMLIRLGTIARRRAPTDSR